jgi:hypothetical protein
MNPGVCLFRSPSRSRQKGKRKQGPRSRSTRLTSKANFDDRRSARDSSIARAVQLWLGAPTFRLGFAQQRSYAVFSVSPLIQGHPPRSQQSTLQSAAWFFTCTARYRSARVAPPSSEEQLRDTQAPTPLSRRKPNRSCAKSDGKPMVAASDALHTD